MRTLDVKPHSESSVAVSVVFSTSACVDPGSQSEIDNFVAGSICSGMWVKIAEFKVRAVPMKIEASVPNSLQLMTNPQLRSLISGGFQHVLVAKFKKFGMSKFFLHGFSVPTDDIRFEILVRQ